MCIVVFDNTGRIIDTYAGFYGRAAATAWAEANLDGWRWQIVQCTMIAQPA